MVSTGYLLSRMQLKLLGDVLPQLHSHEDSVLRTGARSRTRQQLVHPLSTLQVPLLQLDQHPDVDLDLPVELVDLLQAVVDLVVDRRPVLQLVHLLVQLGLHVLGEENLDNLIGVRDGLEDRLDVLADVCRILHPVLVVLNPSIQVVKLRTGKNLLQVQEVQNISLPLKRLLQY